ncbi:EAL domain-containing protein [Pseudomaricurvus alkylphenolicus]|uniref:EAL domain-containing protein n=1 Tax=Pseudomaricurvus alkylphenolicus TaxID=1306991 RepID=UPI0014233E66|nr:EAL domain-containing protein [Pseudomaricurvus alkylphenolicus]
MQSFFQGISYRLAKVGVILAFALGLAMSSFQLYLDFQAQEDELDLLVGQVIEVAAPPATRAVHTLDDDLSSEVVNGLLAYDFIYEVAVLDELGNVLARGEKPRPKTSTSWLTGYISQSSKVYTSRLKIPGYGDTAAGSITFKVDLNSALGNFYQRSKLVILSGMVRNMLLVLLLFVAFYYTLTSPLIRMLKEIQSIRPEEPGHHRITVPNPQRQDELTQLAISSNQLLDAVGEAFVQRLHVEQALRDSEEAIRMIINELPAMVGVQHLDGTIEFANQNMASFFGKTVESIAGVNMMDFGFTLETSTSRSGSSAQPGQSEMLSGSFEGYFEAVSGQKRYLQGHVKPITLKGERFSLIVATDISARKEAEEKMEYMAYHDALTNLPNRVHLVERLEHEIVRARRHRYYGAVLFIDLDHFKNINDSLGHPVGDQLLKQVAQRLLNSVREEDLVARLSGDEFVVVLTVLDQDLDTAGLKAGEVAEKIRKSLSQPYPYKDMKLHVSCSIGIVVYSDNETSVHELLRFADTAMYQVKDKGRDAIEFFNLGMADKVSHQLQLEGELHKAFAEQQFLLYYQPKVCIESGRILGAEALLRWEHPKRGLVSPGEFIPILEASGLMMDVGLWIIEEGCRTLRTLAYQGLWGERMKLSLNISPRQFRGQNFVDDMARVLHEIAIPDNSLDIEITEGVVIQNVEETISTMTTLSSMGISFSLDDFGTGYSSISYLKRLPVTTLKIDYSFVRDIVTDRNDRVLVETIVTMGKLLDLDVVAEGVEEKSQLDMLAAFGCSCYQGFYYSKPVPLDEFVLLLEKDKQLDAALSS